MRNDGAGSDGLASGSDDEAQEDHDPFVGSPVASEQKMWTSRNAKAWGFPVISKSSQENSILSKGNRTIFDQDRFPVKMYPMSGKSSIKDSDNLSESN